MIDVKDHMVLNLKICNRLMLKVHKTGLDFYLACSELLVYINSSDFTRHST